MKRIALISAAVITSLPFAAAAALPAQAAAVYHLKASYGHGEYQDKGNWLCVKDDKADGKGVKIVLSWYDNGYHTITKKAPPKAEPATCIKVKAKEGMKVLLTLSRSDGSKSKSRSVKI